MDQIGESWQIERIRRLIKDGDTPRSAERFAWIRYRQPRDAPQ